jgi:hypothetical protein
MLPFDPFSFLAVLLKFIPQYLLEISWQFAPKRGATPFFRQDDSEAMKEDLSWEWMLREPVEFQVEF